MKILILCLIHLSAIAATDESAPRPDDTMIVTPGLDKQSAPLVNAPGSYIRVDQGKIKQRKPDTLEGALGATPGVQFTGGPRTQAQIPQIRGLNASRILILEDGVRQNFQSTHNGRLFGDFSLTESVEVVKGPWSSLYGSGAMGGVMSFRRSTAADFARRYEMDQGVQLALDTSTANSGFGQRVTAFKKTSFFEPLISYHHSDSSDTRLGDGLKLENSSAESEDLYSSLGFNLGKSQRLTFKLNRYQDKSRIPLQPEQPLGTTNLLGDNYIDKRDVSADYSLKKGAFDFHAKPYWRETMVRKTQVSNGRVDIQTVETTGIDAWNNWKRDWSDSFSSTLTLGVDYFKDENDGERNGGALDSFPDGESSILGIYFQPSLTWQKLTVTPGVRWDSYKLKDSTGAATSSDDSATSFKTYVSYELGPKKSIFAGWGQSFNAPRLQDMYITGQHFPGNFFQPNPALKSEKADTFEAGTKQSWTLNEDNMLVGSATYFVTEARDFISRSVDFGGGTTTFENLDKVRLEGYEASVLFQHVIWGAGLSYAQTRSLDKVTGEPLTDTAADQWMVTAQVYPSEELVVGTDFRYALKQDQVPAGSDTSPAYFAQDFYVTYDWRKFEAAVRLNNAWDRDFTRHGSVIKDTGRDVRAQISWTF